MSTNAQTGTTMRSSGVTAAAHGLVDLAQHEIVGLTKAFNLSDAHTHQRQSRSQRAIVEKLPTLWYRAEDFLQIESERAFIDAFFRQLRIGRLFAHVPPAVSFPRLLAADEVQRTLTFEVIGGGVARGREVRRRSPAR